MNTICDNDITCDSPIIYKLQGDVSKKSCMSHIFAPPWSQWRSPSHRSARDIRHLPPRTQVGKTVGWPFTNTKKSHERNMEWNGMKTKIWKQFDSNCPKAFEGDISCRRFWVVKRSLNPNPWITPSPSECYWDCSPQVPFPSPRSQHWAEGKGLRNTRMNICGLMFATHFEIGLDNCFCELQKKRCSNMLSASENVEYIYI